MGVNDMGVRAWMWLSAIVALAVGGAVPAHGVMQVTSCGTTLVGVGELVGDLDCSGYNGPAVIVDGTLRMNDHTLTGYTDAEGIQPTVDCYSNGIRSCAIVGPGKIVGGGIGVYGPFVRMKYVTITGAGTGIDAGRAHLRSCKIDGNGQVIPGLGNVLGGGIAIGYRLTLVDSTVTDNGFYGIYHHGQLQSKLDLKRSTIVGNGNVAAYCSGRPINCGDIVTWTELKRVSLRATTCDISRLRDTGTSLGICSGD
jgi:hypothetical protein